MAIVVWRYGGSMMRTVKTVEGGLFGLALALILSLASWAQGGEDPAWGASGVLFVNCPPNRTAPVTLELTQALADEEIAAAADLRPEFVRSLYCAQALGAPGMELLTSTLSPDQAAALRAVEVDLIEQLYLPWLASMGLHAPDMLGTWVTRDDQKLFRVLHFEPGIGALGQYRRGASCPDDDRSAAGPDNVVDHISLAPQLLGGGGSIPSPVRLAEVAVHEMMHASIRAGSDNCGLESWFEEGIADAFAMQATWRHPTLRALHTDPANSRYDPQEWYGWRNYTVPLDIQSTTVFKFGRVRGDVQAQRGEEAYYTQSFWRYAMEALSHDGNESDVVARAIVSPLFGGAQRVGRAIDANNQPRAHLERFFNNELSNQTFGEYLAGFYTEYASYGGSRYVDRVLTRDGVNWITDIDEIRYTWVDVAFGCAPEKGATTSATFTNGPVARKTIDIDELPIYAARCVRVKWDKLATPRQLAIHVGVAYAANAQMPERPGALFDEVKEQYCYAGLINSNTPKNALVNSNRGRLAGTEKCLLRRQKRVGPDESGPFIAEFLTRFEIGAEAGQAIFIITNAPEELTEQQKQYSTEASRIRIAPEGIRVSILNIHGHNFAPRSDDHQHASFSIGGDDIYVDGFEGMIGDHADVDPATKQRLSGMLARNTDALAYTRFDENGFLFDYAETPDNRIIQLMAPEQGNIAFAMVEPDPELQACGFAHALTVEEEDALGVTLSAQMDVIDVQLGMQVAAANPDASRCDQLAGATVRQESLDIYLPMASTRSLRHRLTTQGDDDADDHRGPIGVNGFPIRGGYPLAHLQPYRGPSWPSLGGGGAIAAAVDRCATGPAEDAEACLDELTSGFGSSMGGSFGVDPLHDVDTPDGGGSSADDGADDGADEALPTDPATIISELEALTTPEACACTCAHRDALDTSINALSRLGEHATAPLDPDLQARLNTVARQAGACYQSCALDFVACE